MTNIIDLKNYKNSKNKDPDWFEKYPSSEYYDEEVANHFGTHTKWDGRAVMHLMEQLKNYMDASDDSVSFCSIIALDTALISYEEQNNDSSVRAFLSALKHLERWSSIGDEVSKEAMSALTDICDILYEKYPNI